MITISAEHKDKIKAVCSVAPAKHSTQALENVYIECANESISIKCGDGLMELSSAFPCAVESGFIATVNAQKFMQSFNACATKGDVTVMLKDSLTVKSGRTRFNLQPVSPESYPAFVDDESDRELPMNGSKFVHLVKSVSFAAAKNDVRYYLNGVYVGDHFVATNGHRMALTQSDFTGFEFIVPLESVSKMPELGDSTVVVGNNVLSITGSDTTFKTKLVDGRYPDYKRAIPKCDKSIAVNTADMVSSIKSAAITAKKDSPSILVSVSDESYVSATSEKKESSKIGIDAEGDHIDMAFNSSYLLDAFNAVESEVTNVQISDSAMMIEDLMTLVVMKVRL